MQTLAYNVGYNAAYNVSEDVMSSKSLISLRDQPIENVRSFKYLGHVLFNDPSKSSAFLMHQMSSTHAKWNEMKSVFLVKRIFLSIRVKFSEARFCNHFRTGLATVCRRNAEIGIGLVGLFKAFSERWFL